MKALLAVIAVFSIAPAHALDNLIVDSAFQHPVVLSGSVQGNGWTNVASSPSVALISGSVGGIAAAATKWSSQYQIRLLARRPQARQQTYLAIRALSLSQRRPCRRVSRNHRQLHQP